MLKTGIVKRQPPQAITAAMKVNRGIVLTLPTLLRPVFVFSEAAGCVLITDLAVAVFDNVRPLLPFL